MRRALVRHCLLLCALAMALPAAWSAPRLRCQIWQGGMNYALEFKPGSDPYSVKAIEIGERFRFKAVLIGDEEKVEYLKTYVYAQTERQPVLVHTAHYVSPRAEVGPKSLTGVNLVYAPRLERELQFDCALYEVTAP